MSIANGCQNESTVHECTGAAYAMSACARGIQEMLGGGLTALAACYLSRRLTHTLEGFPVYSHGHYVLKVSLVCVVPVFWALTRG